MSVFRMFQSDDFDVLLDEELLTLESECDKNDPKFKSNPSIVNTSNVLSNSNRNDQCTTDDNEKAAVVSKDISSVVRNRYDENFTFDSPKRKKRKFPGPAGLLPEHSHDSFHENKNLVLSSQICISQSQDGPTVFGDAPWCVMKNEFSTNKLVSQYTIAYINAKALSQQLIGRRAPILAGVIQSIDRNLQYPSVIIRDPTGEIQGTLHRDVWDIYSSYLVPQYSVIALKNIPVLTTGSALRRNYLNITLKNIIAVYCDSENVYIPDKSKILPPYPDVLSKHVNVENVDYEDSNVIIVRNLYKDSSDKSVNKSLKRKSDESIELLLQGIDCESLVDDFN